LWRARADELQSPALARSRRRNDGRSPLPRRSSRHATSLRLRREAASFNTALKRAEAELRQAQKMDLVGTLAGGIAHDFNNVLAAIMAEASYAATEPDVLPAAVRESLAAIIASAERGAALTYRLLTFARPERERPRSVVDLGDLLGNLLPMLRRLLPASIELDVQAAAPCAALVDASQIEQVIVNLLVNARDAIAGTGRISVLLEPVVLDAAADLELSAGPYVRLAVSDSGAGIDREIIERIFDPFFTTKPLGQGTGLGLSVVLSIAKHHRGTVSVRSAVGAGTRFEVYLPGVEAAAVRPRKPPPIDARARPGETILLAEDEPAVRRSVMRILANAGYRVLCAEDGSRALEVYRRHAAELSLVMLDAVMPGMSGQRVYEALVAEAPPRLRVLFSSGYAAAENDPELRLGPGCAFLAKPYQSGQLLATIRSLIDA
jgi:signal transduction histidine kinase